MFLTSFSAEKSGIQLSSVGPSPEFSTSLVQIPSSGGTPPALDKTTTNDPNLSPSPTSRLHILEKSTNFLRKASPRSWKKKKGAESQSSHTAVTDSDGAEIVSQTPTTESGSVLAPLRNALPVISIEDNTPSISDDESRRIQSATGLWVHIKWAHHVRADLEKCIRDIKDTVDILDRTLSLRDLNEPQHLVHVESMSPSTSKDALNEYQNLLLDVHLALGRLQKPLKSPPRNLSIALLEDCNELWRQANEEQSELSLEENGLILWLQLQDHDQPTQSTFLIVEAVKSWSTEHHFAETYPALVDLARPAATTAENETRNYEAWGALLSPKWVYLRHMVFAERKPWHRVTTLRDLVQREDVKNILTRRALADLAMQLLEGYLRLLSVAPSCSNLRSDNVAYYRPANEQIDMSDPDWLLHPYISCGFGSPAPERRLGLQSGPLKDPNAAIIEIGLVLFQLGSHRVVNYDPHVGKVMPATLKLVRRESLHRLNEVEVTYGPKFANVVSACLQAKASNHVDVVRNAIATLSVLKDEFDAVDEMI